MEKCKWCGTECVNLNSLSQHITNKHKKSHKLYYDSFILKNEQDKFCICGKEKRYSHGLSGYYKNCGNINCRNILMNIAERKTCEEKYGNATYRNITLNKQTKKNYMEMKTIIIVYKLKKLVFLSMGKIIQTKLQKFVIK